MAKLFAVRDAGPNRLNALRRELFARVENPRVLTEKSLIYSYIYYLLGYCLNQPAPRNRQLFPLVGHRGLWSRHIEY